MALDKLPAAVDEVARGLSDEQRAAALAPEPFVRVMVAAGAGKTETLVRRVLYLVRTGVIPGEIGVFTYNVRAAEELKERVYARAEDFLPSEVVHKVGEMFVGTIHSFAAHILLDHLGYGGFDILDENQETAFVIQRGWDLGIQSGPGYMRRCQEFLRSHEVVCNELIEVSKLLGGPDSDRTFGNLVRAYRDLLYEHRLLTFGLLIGWAVKELSEPRIVLPYQHYIVDEFQDVNPAHEQLLDRLLRLRPGSTCFVVGDPRQCIYEWRGSDPGCFDRFQQRYGAATYTIATNRRSGRAVINAANILSGCFEDPALRAAMVSADGAGAGLAVHVAHDTPEEEARWIAQVIREAVASGTAQYRDFAVLLRSVRTSGEPFIRPFSKYGIPYLVGGRLGLFRRPEIAAVARTWVWCAGLRWPEGPGTPWESGDQILEQCARLWPGNFPQAVVREFRDEVLAQRHLDLVVANYKLLELLGVSEWDPPRQHKRIPSPCTRDEEQLTLALPGALVPFGVKELSGQHPVPLLARPSRRDVNPMGILEEVTREHFYLPFRSRRDVERIAGNVAAALRRCLQAHPDVVRRVVEAEARMEFMLDPGYRIVISGRADILRDAGGDELEVVDFKMGEDPGERAEDAALQVQLYALGLSYTGHQVRSGRVDRVTKHRVTKVPVDDRALHRARRLAVGAARNIVERRFPPKPAAPVCGQCDVRSVCRWAV